MGISVEVHNLGPLESARIELADLNVLVGENNTGKSFFATVLHRVAASADASNAPARRDFDEIPDQFRDLIAKLLPLASSQDQARLAKEFQPDKSTMRWLEAVATDLLRSFGNEIRHGVASAYGTTPSALRRRTLTGPAPDSFVRVAENEDAMGMSWSVLVGFDSDDTYSEDIDSDGIEVAPPSVSAWLAQLLDDGNLGFAMRFLSPERIGAEPEPADITNACWRLLIAAGRAILLAGCPVEAVHLPAERGGIVQNGRVLVSRALRQMTHLPSRQPRDPHMTRTTIDLLGHVILTGTPSPAGTPGSELAGLAASFEQQLGASIELEDEGWDIPAIIAVTPEGRFPLAQASSMLSELAPLLLVVKHRLASEHCLTIDEPEAHLHPEVQRQVASFLAQLATVGTTVILTTHSNFFVGQLNNHIRAHALAQLPSPPDMLPTPSIDPADVRALWFSRGKGGCVAESIAVDRSDGINQGVFTGAMREMHIETAGTINPLLEVPVD
ncbi:AAA family ATPase [Candidatus Poriferisodalis sp.]|uniref:AAA family ATPase n=1 Tax=Candidatus Poriferisodalis sp. TaxID=3101277 RepID=UPI003AF6E745